MINASKGGHPILLRAVAHHLPHRCHRVHSGCKTKQRGKTIATQIIASNVFLCSMSSSLSAPHQHKIACASKAHLIDEVNTSYNYQFILNSAATKHISGILKMFTAIKCFPKNYKGILILGDGVTKLKVHGIGTITVEIQKID